MRKINQDIREAIFGKYNLTQQNTLVEYVEEEDISKVSLHGNSLGFYDHKEGKFKVDIGTLKNYPTATTNRLRGLDVDVKIKAGKPYIDGEAV